MSQAIVQNLRWQWGRLNRRGAAEPAERRCLVVFVPGIYASLPQAWQYDELLTHLDDVLWRRYHQRDWLPFHYLATFWSTSHPRVIAQALIRQIESAVSRQEYDAVILIAHSFGGLILRQAILQASDRPWFVKAERIVLLASTSRGLIPATRLQKWLASFGKYWGLNRWGIGRLALTGLKPSAWLKELASGWRSWLLNRANGQPLVVQIQGDRDRVIELGDDADLGAIPGVREEILPGVGHRYFLLRARWFQSADPAVAEALHAVRRAVDRSVRERF